MLVLSKPNLGLFDGSADLLSSVVADDEVTMVKLDILRNRRLALSLFCHYRLALV